MAGDAGYSPPLPQAIATSIRARRSADQQPSALYDDPETKKEEAEYEIKAALQTLARFSTRSFNQLPNTDHHHNHSYNSENHAYPWPPQFGEDPKEGTACTCDEADDHRDCEEL
ncbi:hypothetical protein D6850_00015 [Roseovarius spongiae]|uniref:Uncharacterized protein n=1 Tax=Roseovarius spongiae TaxID=2320272 RepID=A0A3A8AXC0_9RHOB|nr:hypothetical protein D6850_00015 [Roseovarius spongiae]